MKNLREHLIKELDSIAEFFERSTRCLTEADSNFAPAEGTITVAQQVAHAAQCIDWMIDAIKSPDGFDLDFEAHWKEVLPVTSLEAARQWFSKSISQAKQTVVEMTEAELQAPLPQGPVMGGEPKLNVIAALVDHTAHHRGALTIYSRILGREPLMPYIEM